ncbi:hypothetical protein MKX50_21570 [Paenibacillus sp. FSL W8-0186]|uniref:Uncharacterized protein n=2 Tax=Paenibacillus woosongensis TaxID=307580 RepID=A0ABQ4MWW0_9BACL|nr:hypothetical protein [Paenibacillus woosongensis]GIP60403.1 hypothetical protein J15TS10_42170 [Paenibacillus woosongensis]
MKITLDPMQKDSISSHFNVEINAVEISPEEMQHIDGGSLERPIVTTLAIGEECDGPIMTTLALGEEDGGPIATTLALGEEGGATTLALGEECF